MTSAVVSEPNGPWVLEDREVPDPGPHQVLVRVRACGICGTDMWIAHGKLSFRSFPLVLGHEGVGEVVALGAGVTEFDVGDRVGMPMVQKRCGRCAFCREEHPNSFVTAANCENPVLTGITVDGAQAEYMVADVGGVVRVPDGVPDELAAPTLCAGYTVWAALRRADVRPGARVGVVGLGGLGHLAVQYAKAAGYDVTAVTRSADKQELAGRLGADRAVADGDALRNAGRVDLLMHTSSSHAAVVDAMKGLRPWGKIVANGIAFDDMHIPMLDLVSNSFQVVGSAHNGFSYLAEAFDFVASGAVKPMVEVFPKEQLPGALKRVDNGEVRFKAVITY